MPDSMSISVDSRGHTITVVAAMDGVAWNTGTTEVDATKILNLLVDSGGAFERTLYAQSAKAGTISFSNTNGLANDTATVVIPTNGEHPNETSGSPELHDAYTGESVELGASLGAGFITDGTNGSLGVVSGASVTNNSTVAKSAPVCVNITEPGRTIQDGSLVVTAFIEAGEGVDASACTAVLTDSALAEHTVAMSRVKISPDDGFYSSSAPGVAALSVWRGTIDVSSASDGIGQVHIEATGVNGAVADHSVDGDATVPVLIDNAVEHTEYFAAVDESFTMTLNGTFTLDQDAIIEGATSGVRAICEESVDNSGGGDVTVTLVRITPPSTPWTDAESITGLTSGSATVNGITETPAGTGSATTSTVQATAEADPFDSVGRAQEFLAQAKLAGTGVKNGGGCTIVILSRHFTKGGRTAVGFGSSAHTAQRQAIRIIGKLADNTEHYLIGGGASVARDRTIWCSLFEDITIQAITAGTADRPWAFSSGDDVLMMTKRCRFLGLGPEVSLNGPISNVKETWHEHIEVEDYDSNFTAGSDRSRIKVSLWVKLDGKLSDGDQMVGQGLGNSLFVGRTNDLRGFAAGTHGDVIQWTGDVQNVVAVIYADECSYQGVFSNNQDGDDKLRRAYISVFVKQVNDGDVGSLAIAINQSVDGLIIDFTTSVTFTATVGSETPKNASLNIISETGRSDNVWVRNSYFEGWGAQLWNEDGNSDAPYGASCAVNCHVQQGEARGVRCTSSADTGDAISDLFVDPWTNGGESPGNDDTDWRTKASSTMDSRLLARDIVGTHYDMISGEAFAAGGGIGMAVEPSAAGSSGPRKTIAQAPSIGVRITP